MAKRIKLPTGPKPTVSKIDARDYLRDISAAEIERQIEAHLAHARQARRMAPEVATAQRATSRDRFAGLVAMQTVGKR